MPKHSPPLTTDLRDREPTAASELAEIARILDPEPPPGDQAAARPTTDAAMRKAAK